MKNWLLAAIFVVSWNEYELKPHEFPGKIIHSRMMDENGVYQNVNFTQVSNDMYFTVETTTHTIKLATQKDVDLFVGPPIIIFGEDAASEKFSRGISINAFNISVKEEDSKP